MASILRSDRIRSNSRLHTISVRSSSQFMLMLMLMIERCVLFLWVEQSVLASDDEVQFWKQNAASSHFLFTVSIYDVSFTHGTFSLNVKRHRAARMRHFFSLNFFFFFHFKFIDLLQATPAVPHTAFIFRLFFPRTSLALLFVNWCVWLLIARITINVMFNAWEECFRAIRLVIWIIHILRDAHTHTQ